MPPIKHAYAALQCKTCSSWLVLKYLGAEDGKTAYALVFPEPPRLVVFSIPCQKCGSTNQYSRNDVKPLSIETAPSSDFVDQIPSVVVKSHELGSK